MEIKIREIRAMELMGQKILTSISKKETSKLWKPFRQTLKEKDLFPKLFYSIHRYGKAVQEGSFSLDTQFEKCAAIELDFDRIDGFEKISLEGGKYAVFEHSGSVSKFQQAMQKFYQEWLPSSGYGLDNRAHFETFDESYDPFSESSVELIWTPIKVLK
ncbi:GyrI-like domain-containing protein [Algoriphagus lutimaris]|uniref:GyrI-like domain-containing protein n=1 Tax=Algoriphagus lutimaris TaxID=613197 RepID=UPI00196AC886|nr:GyrI-like domain-containing protein [Algoriphagus lutimaris]MBN3519848.1 GyrI-like domain-containing protein [Algoriphagus lutimaris]